MAEPIDAVRHVIQTRDGPGDPAELERARLRLLDQEATAELAEGDLEALLAASPDAGPRR
jgi:hypothetical protein